MPGEPKETDVTRSYGELLSSIVTLLEQGRQFAARSVNAVLTSTYWLVGQRLVEHEQGGEERAVYGAELLKRLSRDLQTRLGREFSERNLEQMRQFYLGWPISQTASSNSSLPTDSNISQTPSAKFKSIDRPHELICEMLERVLASRTFSNAPNMGKLLEFCVQETISGRRQTQVAIAEILNYREFDSLQHSNVRREMGRLRNKLRDYYDQEGASDPLIISVPKASSKVGYCAEFQLRRSASRESKNPRYLQLVCEARHLWGQRMPGPTMEAIKLYEEAVREDPEHAASAEGGLAECYCFMALWGFPPRETVPKAKEWALRAITSNPEGPPAYAVLAFAAAVYDWDWKLADEFFEKALTLNPESVEVHCWYASHLICTGRFSEAIEVARTAQSLQHDPSVVVLSHLGKVMYVAGDLDHAFDLLQLTLQMNPNFYLTHWYLGMILLDRGNVDVGLDHLRKAAELAPESSGVIASLAYALAMLGQRQESLRHLRAMERMREERYVPASDFATIHSGLGDLDSAFAALERAFLEKCIHLTWLHAWPPYQHLRCDSRFAELSHRLGLGGGNGQVARSATSLS